MCKQNMEKENAIAEDDVNGIQETSCIKTGCMFMKKLSAKAETYALSSSAHA